MQKEIEKILVEWQGKTISSSDHFQKELKQTLERYTETIKDLIVEKKHRTQTQTETYYRTIMNSDIWQDWVKYQEDNEDFDVHESMELGLISDRHWNAFIDWVKNN